jgi:Protein kinase domain
LKPANIKLMVRGNAPPRANDGRSDRGLPLIDVDDCTVKVLDFGLAKAFDTAAGVSGNALNSPTITARATELGTILGTAAYMSPEQARGKAVDRRADVWAFGVVCYEMLTGSRLFKGEDVSDTMAAVLRQPIDLAALPPGTPTAVRRLLERCLEREPRQRLRDIGEARVALERIGATPEVDASASGTAPTVTPRSARTVVPWILLAMTVTALVALVGALLGPWGPAQPNVPAPVTRLVSNIGVPGSLMVDAGPAAVLSPDGRTIVLRVRRENTARLYVRRLEQLDPIELAGTEGATNPFFSPEGTQLGFFASGGLKTMPVAGGAIATLTDARTGRGVWAANGDIVFQSSLFPKTPLLRVNAAGTRIDGGTTLAPEESTHRWPQILPGRRVIYSSDEGKSGIFNLFWRRADGSGPAERLTSGSTIKHNPSVHPGGHFVMFGEASGSRPGDVSILPLVQVQT